MQREFTGVLQSFGGIGSMFGPRTTVAVGATTSVAIPAGAWLIECDANSTVRYTYDGGSTFVTQIAASGVGIVASDGFAVEFRGGASPGSPKRTQILSWQ